MTDQKGDTNKFQHTYLLIPDRESMIEQKEKIQMPCKSKLVNQCVLLAFLTGVKMRDYLQNNDITKAHPSMGDSSQKLGAWSTLRSLQAAQ